ncbi:GNAT family N-acetyltransferase [bacterium]|nr:GNAT family N-acetyltransferase [bacterium]
MSILPDNLIIRRARDSDLTEMARIHASSYPGAPLTFEERIRHIRENPRLPLEDNWVCERDGRLIGIFALYNFRMYRGESIIPAGGIGRVAVAPEARLEKIAYYMMKHAVEVMDQNGIPVSILHPFRHSFYRKLGWGLTSNIRFWQIPPQYFPLYPERSNMNPALTNDNFEEIMACYHHFAEHHPGLLVRDDPVWYETILKNSIAYTYRSEEFGGVEGYIIYKYDKLAKPELYMVSDLEIREIVFNNKSAFKGILGFLSSQRDQIRSINYHDHYNLPLEYIIKEPLTAGGISNMWLGAETARIGAAIMVRIVQLRRILSTVSYSNCSGEVTLNIKDELNPANSEKLFIEINSGKLDFKKRNSTDLSLSTDIATFSSIYWGALSLKDALYHGLVEIEGKSDDSFIFDFLNFPKSICMDYF